MDRCAGAHRSIPDYHRHINESTAKRAIFLTQRRKGAEKSRREHPLLRLFISVHQRSSGAGMAFCSRVVSHSRTPPIRGHRPGPNLSAYFYAYFVFFLTGTAI